MIKLVLSTALEYVRVKLTVLWLLLLLLLLWWRRIEALLWRHVWHEAGLGLSIRLSILRLDRERLDWERLVAALRRLWIHRVLLELRGRWLELRLTVHLWWCYGSYGSSGCALSVCHFVDL